MADDERGDDDTLYASFCGECGARSYTSIATSGENVGTPYRCWNCGAGSGANPDPEWEVRKFGGFDDDRS